MPICRRSLQTKHVLCADKTTVKLLNQKLHYRKPEILLAFLLKFYGRRHQHHDCESIRRYDSEYGTGRTGLVARPGHGRCGRLRF